MSTTTTDTLSFLEVVRPCGHAARRALSAAVPVIGEVIDLRHTLGVWAVPRKTVEYDGRYGFAAFFLDGINADKPAIYIATQKPERSLSDAWHERELLFALSHELAHYEQWRDGRELTERGVQVRARNLAKQLRRRLAPGGGE